MHSDTNEFAGLWKRPQRHHQIPTKMTEHGCKAKQCGEVGYLCPAPGRLQDGFRPWNMQNKSQGISKVDLRLTNFRCVALKEKHDRSKVVFFSLELAKAFC